MGHSRNDRRWTPLVNTRIALCYTAALLILCIIPWGSSSTGSAVSAADLESMDFAGTAIPTKPKITVIPTKPKITVIPTKPKRPIRNFATPLPVSTVVPDSPGNRNIPSVFDGIKKYSPIPATLTRVYQPPSQATDLAKAALSVVKILGCDQFGCKTPIGSGVIVHQHGLILTAYHVLLIEPDEPTSERYRDFVIAVTEKPNEAPVERYKARWVASKVDEGQDLAILAIDRDIDNKPVVANELNLSVLPLAKVKEIFGGKLEVLGYPVNGGEAIRPLPIGSFSFDDNGRSIVVDQPFAFGDSGGPALLKKENGYAAIAGIVLGTRITQGELNQRGLLRSIDQLYNLTWTRRFTRTWGEDVQAHVQGTGASAVLQVSLTIHTVDMISHTLRLLFYAVDATDTPWRPTTTAGPLVIWADIKPQTVIERQTLTLTVPVKSLGDIAPEQLRFAALLSDIDKGVPLWSDATGVQAISVTDTIVPTSVPTSEGADTPTASVATPQPTTTPTNTASPTPQPTPTHVPSPQPTMPPEEALTNYFALIDQALTSSGSDKIGAYSIAFRFLSDNFIKSSISDAEELKDWSNDFEKYQHGWEDNIGRPTIQSPTPIRGKTKSGDTTVTLNIYYAIAGGPYKICYVLRQDELGIQQFGYWLIVGSEFIINKPTKACA